MQKYQREFIDFAIGVGVLQFGEFILKSGRKSPYFFNAGLFNTGGSLAKLGRFYAQAIVNSVIEFDMLFGPTYKGIPLAATAGIALADQHNRDVPFAFNRKEAKDHGEGGIIVGSPLQNKVLIIDDVISAGTSVRESADIIKVAGADLAGVVIALDRQERGQGDLSAIQEVEQSMGIAVTSIVNLDCMVEYLSENPKMKANLEFIQAYRAEYGVMQAR